MVRSIIVVAALCLFLLLPIVMTVQSEHRLQSPAGQDVHAGKELLDEHAVSWMSASETEQSAPHEQVETQAVDQVQPDKLIVVIDAGHGGDDPGTTGASKQYEKWFTLSLANKVYALLEFDVHYHPVMMRTEDTFMLPEDRAARANELEADVYLSLHANSYKSKRVRGTETFYEHEHSLPLAELLHKHIVEEAGFPDREVKRMDYKVITLTRMASALLEIGYISHPEEEAAMLQDDFQQRIAEAIVEGLQEYRITFLQERSHTY